MNNNDKLIILLDTYRLRQVISKTTARYCTASKYRALKKTLKQVGELSPWFGMVISTFSVLHRIGIKTSLAKAAIVLSTSILAIPPLAYGGYQGALFILHRTGPDSKKSMQSVTLHTLPDTASPGVTAPRKTAPAAKTVSTRRPGVGVLLIGTDIKGVRSEVITQLLLSRLPKERFRLMKHAGGGNGRLTHFAEGLLTHTGSGFVLEIQVTGMDGRYVHNRAYTFETIGELDSAVTQAAEELSNADF